MGLSANGWLNGVPQVESEVRGGSWAFSTGPLLDPASGSRWAGVPREQAGSRVLQDSRALAKAAQWPWPSSEPLLSLSLQHNGAGRLHGTQSFLLLPPQFGQPEGQLGWARPGLAWLPQPWKYRSGALALRESAATEISIPLARPGPPRVSYSLGIDLQEHCYLDCDLTVKWTKDLTRTLQQLTTPLPHSSQRTLLKAFREFRYFAAVAFTHLAWPSINLSVCSKLWRFVVVWPHCAKGTQTCISATSWVQNLCNPTFILFFRRLTLLE